MREVATIMGNNYPNLFQDKGFTGRFEHFDNIAGLNLLEINLDLKDNLSIMLYFLSIPTTQNLGYI